MGPECAMQLARARLFPAASISVTAAGVAIPTFAALWRNSRRASVDVPVAGFASGFLLMLSPS